MHGFYQPTAIPALRRLRSIPVALPAFPLRLILALALPACAPLDPTPQLPPAAAIAATTARFTALLGNHPAPAARAEAARLARTAECQARALACQYRVCPPARWHNFLVNLHLKKRGLCWHYMEDLRAAMLEQHPRHFEFHCAARDKGQPIFEHSALVITAAGRPFDTGLILDPWRQPGNLLVFPVRANGSPWLPQVRSCQPP